MSKSLGTIVDPLEAADRLGPDPLRLYLSKEITYGHDGDFSWERFEERYNVDLANNFGNLVSRVTSMANRYRKGKLSSSTGSLSNLAERATSIVSRYRKSMDCLAIHQGVSAAFDLIDATNGYIAEVQPWVVAKDPDRAVVLDQQLFDVSEAIRLAAVLLLPVMPTSAAEVLRRVGETRDVSSLRLDVDGKWINSGERTIIQGDALWPRLEQEKEQRIMDQSKEGVLVTDNSKPDRSSGKELGAAKTLPEITIDDFFKIDIRVGRVLSAEPVPKSRKLIRVQIDTGNGELQILAGILGEYQPEALVGRTVVFVANLKPAKLAGLESSGMILAASSPDDGKPVLLTVDDVEAAPPGSKVS